MKSFFITLFLLLAVTQGAIAQTVLAKANELGGSSAPDQIAPRPNVIDSEAEIALKTASGVEEKLSALRGRVVVLNFWATYCGPCVKEVPDLVAIQKQYAAHGVQVVGASLDTLAERKEVRKFVTDMRINFPVWLGATNEDMARFGLGQSVPSTIVIGRDGKIVTVFRGAIRQADLRRQLNALVASRRRGKSS